MVPDRSVVRKIKDYDPSLYVLWNEDDEFFELWRKMDNGAKRLVTPITRSIYNATAPRSYVQLDERIIWWLYEADSWRQGGSKRLSMEQDRRFKEFKDNLAKQQLGHLRDVVKDCYGAARDKIFMNQVGPKNKGKPTFNKVPRSNWIAPDVRSNTSDRVFTRSAANARAFGFKGKK